MIRKQTFTYTGLMPSGNPFEWYYDENQNTAFLTSREVEDNGWERKPKKGDVIELHKNSDYITVMAVINRVIVYKKQSGLC